MKVKNMVTLAVLTALYVALSAMMKVPFIGNISLDLGYIAFVIALMLFGYKGIIVGVVGCALESILFSAYGFSISWAVGNLLVGLIFVSGVRKNFYNPITYMVLAALGCFVGIGIAKTAIESYLYTIPLAIKFPKNLIATVVDTITMWVGIWIFNKKTLDRLRGM